MVDPAKVYALTGAAPWINFHDSGYHHQEDGTLGPREQRDADAIFNAAIVVYVQFTTKYEGGRQRRPQ